MRIIANERLFFFRGTLAPFFRAFDSPIAIACFRLLAFPPLPLFCVPRFSVDGFIHLAFALDPYLAIIVSFPNSGHVAFNAVFSSFRACLGPCVRRKRNSLPFASL